MKNILIVTMLFVCAAYTSATFAVEETIILDDIHSNDIKISNDGTGIVSNIQCELCTSKLVTIDSNTKIYINGSLVENTNVKKASKNEIAAIEFNAITNKVLIIHW